MHRASRGIVVCLLMLGAVAPAHAADLPVAIGETYPTSRWASVAFTADNREFELEAWMNGTDDGLQKNYLEINFYREDGTIIQPWGLIVRPGSTGVLVHAENEDGVLVHQDVRQHSETSPILAAGVALGFNWAGSNFPYVGRFKVLFIQHGDVADWWWRIEGTGVSVQATDTGDRTFYLVSEEFDHATLNAQVEERPVYSVRAQVGLQETIQVQDTLAAMFGTNALISVNDITIESEGQEPRDCRTQGRLHACYFENFAGPEVVGQGTYTLRMTSAGEGNPFGDIVLAGADARLPAFPS